MSHVLDLLDWDGTRLLQLLKDAAKLTKAHLQGKGKPLLAGRVLGMFFEKPSLRTRVSFEAAMAQLGGASVFMTNSDGPLGKRESIADFARTLSQYVNAMVLRTFHHATIVEFARFASCPVINGLSDYYHPCQALGDLLTLQEQWGDLKGKTLAFVGDGNNVARSLAVVCGKVGMHFVLCCPKEYGFDKEFLQIYRQHVPGGGLMEEHDPKKAVARADAIYTDVWTSMGQESEAAVRKQKFAPYQVNAALLRAAPKNAKVLHCLPAHRGEEITDEMMDGPASIVFPQAGNRLHAQKALLVEVMK